MSVLSNTRNCVNVHITMGDGRSLPDNVSASSDDSVRPPQRLDPSRIKPGPGALPPESFDPLKHDEWEQFWHTIDQHFQPINEDDIWKLGSIYVNPYGGAQDPDLRLLPTNTPVREESSFDGKRKERRDSKKSSVSPARSDHAKRLPPHVNVTHKYSMISTVEGPLSPTVDSQPSPRTPTDPMTLAASLNSFPYTHRLVAALLDECVTDTPAPGPVVIRSNRMTGPGDDCLWMGVGTTTGIRSYQGALENRVKLELSDAGLLEVNCDESVQSTLRSEQWKLRDLKIINRTRTGALYNQIVFNELRYQAVNREIKRHYDQVEMAYLERMVRNMKKNKKSRSKYQKLLHRMFGHYKERDKTNEKARKAVETVSNGRLVTSGDEKLRSGTKKRKKKPDSKGPPNISHCNGPLPRFNSH